jgi:hypothetical protein
VEREVIRQTKRISFEMYLYFRLTKIIHSGTASGPEGVLHTEDDTMVLLRKNPGSGSRSGEGPNATMHCKHEKINSGSVPDAAHIGDRSNCHAA